MKFSDLLKWGISVTTFGGVAATVVLLGPKFVHKRVGQNRIIFLSTGNIFAIHAAASFFSLASGVAIAPPAQWRRALNIFSGLGLLDFFLPGAPYFLSALAGVLAAQIFMRILCCGREPGRPKTATEYDERLNERSFCESLECS